MMKRRGWVGGCARGGLAAWIILGFAAGARAHFLFIRMEPPAEAGRSAEVYFSEQAEAGDPRFIAKVAHTRLWVSGRGRASFASCASNQAADRLRAALPSDRSLVVVGECQYGVLARPNQTPFLLRYYPKAVAGLGDELNRLTPRKEIPFEIQAAFEGDGPVKGKDQSTGGRVRLVVLRDGKPIPSAVFTVVDSDLSEKTIKAGSDGAALWAPAEPGRYSIYVRETLKQKGSWTARSTMRSASLPRLLSNGRSSTGRWTPRRWHSSRMRSSTALRGAISPASRPRSAASSTGVLSTARSACRPTAQSRSRPTTRSPSPG